MMTRRFHWWQWARCCLIGWHTARQSWRLVYSEYTHRPLYWVYEDRCPYCGTVRRGSRRLYRWHPEHGTGSAPQRPDAMGVA